MKVLSLFSGIGAFEKALEKLEIQYELVGFSEIDKYAIKSYCAIHGVDENLNLGDITKIQFNNLPKDIDLITHGSPCQDFSVAGKQAGGDMGTGTRSSLMWNTVNIITYCKPKYVIWENVKNLLSKKHRHNFDAYISILESLGYNNYYQVLNAKDYGIPQNRERVYTISIRKDIDNGKFVFPEKTELRLRLRDIIEDYVDEKYYLSNTGVNYFINQAKNRNEDITKEKEARLLTVAHGRCKGGNHSLEIAPTLDTQFSNNWRGVLLEPKCIQVGELDIKGMDCVKRVYSPDGLSPTLTDMQGGNRQPKIEEEKETKIRVRKLTPRECWRLMGFSDLDFEKAMKVPTSDSQLYKQARKLDCCKRTSRNI